MPPTLWEFIEPNGGFVANERKCSPLVTNEGETRESKFKVYSELNNSKPSTLNQKALGIAAVSPQRAMASEDYER